MAMNYLSPISEMRDQINRLFADFGGEEDLPMSGRSRSSVMKPMAEWLPPIEVSETEKEMHVSAALPGIKPEDINVDMMGNTLVISGETRQESKFENQRYHRSEFHYGRFTRRIPLPDYVIAEACDAEYKDGMLTVTIPKTEESSRKRISVKTSREGDSAGRSPTRPTG